MKLLKLVFIFFIIFFIKRFIQMYRRLNHLAQQKEMFTKNINDQFTKKNLNAIDADFKIVD
jgi:hypothetical protein